MKPNKYLNKLLLVSATVLCTSQLALADKHPEADEQEIESIEEHKSVVKKMRKHMRTHGGGMHIHDRLDTNEDGKVDLNEFLSHAESRFNKMDLDSDQFVTREEAKQYHKDMRKKHRKMRKEQHRKHREKNEGEGEQ